MSINFVNVPCPKDKSITAIVEVNDVEIDQVSGNVIRKMVGLKCNSSIAKSIQEHEDCERHCVPQIKTQVERI